MKGWRGCKHQRSAPAQIHKPLWHGQAGEHKSGLPPWLSLQLCTFWARKQDWHSHSSVLMACGCYFSSDSRLCLASSPPPCWEYRPPSPATSLTQSLSTHAAHRPGVAWGVGGWAGCCPLAQRMLPTGHSVSKHTAHHSAFSVRWSVLPRRQRQVSPPTHQPLCASACCPQALCGQGRVEHLCCYCGDDASLPPQLLSSLS